jgi:aminoglycoside 2''-phosphotransferase
MAALASRLAAPTTRSAPASRLANILMRVTDSAALAPFLARLRAAYPAQQIDTAYLRAGEGQFNDVLIVNDALVFRFPRSPAVAQSLEHETALLLRLAGRLPLPTPRPTFQGRDPATGALAFIGYAMIPGEPLPNAALDATRDEAALGRMAAQLAAFLRELHSLPSHEVAPDAAPQGAGFWQELGAQFRQKLFPFMRADARGATERLFDELLATLRRDNPAPALIHGDFGGSNILYNRRTLAVTGVLDFGGAGIGDPAVDIAALSGFGDDFVARGFATYPAMQQMLPRARLYRSTFALQQALYALRDGNKEDFDDGIAGYI